MEIPVLEWSPDVKTVGAFKPGDILAIECLHMLTATQFAQLRTNLDRQEERLGVKFILLDYPLKLAGAEIITTKEST